MNTQIAKRVCAAIAFTLVLATAEAFAQDDVAKTMDAVVTRFYASMTLEELYALDDAKLRQLLTPEELKVLATRHWHFDVDVPVVVSVLRDIEQKTVPFWIDEAGFKKTPLIVRNMEDKTYEVWQKNFPAGHVGLGINGFDNHRPHYLACVGPQEAGKTVTISNLYPSKYSIETMTIGAMMYHDWSELQFMEVPKELEGHRLLTTIRGRSREGSLDGNSFRKTQFPALDAPGPIFLTWSEDPKTTQNIQWRTSIAVGDGVARYREKGSTGALLEAKAELMKIEDRMLANDRYCHWFTAIPRGLKPGTTYEYQVGSTSADKWSDFAEFTTAPDGPAPFSFMFCSDTHNRKEWADLIKATFERHSRPAFCVISGDLSVTGLERQNWDEFFTYGEVMYRTRPVMPTIGNHDAQYGLGCQMYLDIFGLPKNGPTAIQPERAYTFTYSNAQFFMLDVMSESSLQREWLRDELAKSTATWKIAVFHFPMYTREAEYPELHEHWGTLFDEYHMDFVLTGHVHTHLRTYPMRAGKKVDSPAEGTIYIQSVSIPSRDLRFPKPEIIEQWLGGGSFGNIIDIDGNTFTFRSYGLDGTVKDEFSVEK